MFDKSSTTTTTPPHIGIMYWVRSVHQSLTSQAPLPPPHLVLELCIGLGPSINVWPVKHHYHHLTNHPTTTIPSYSYVPIIPYLSMDVLCFATKYNSNTIYDHGESLWENVAPYWPVMEFEQVDQLYWLNLSLLLTRGGKNPFHLDDLLHEQRKYTVAAFRGGSSCLYSPSNW